MFDVYDVPIEAAGEIEQLGTKDKFWFDDENGTQFLCKFGRQGTGENWSEKVAAEICKILQIPHANYELATCQDRTAVITPSFVPKGARLVLGNELLVRANDGFSPATARNANPHHTIPRVLALFQGGQILPSSDPAISKCFSSAAEVFCGYLLLDALVGNSDRHEENWGILHHPRSSNSYSALAPTFDHASSLGRELSDKRKMERMTTTDPNYSIAGYARRARSGFFGRASDSKPLATIDAFLQAANHSNGAKKMWLKRLNEVGEKSIKSVLDEVPCQFISDAAQSFAKELLEVNFGRLVACSG